MDVSAIPNNISPVSATAGNLIRDNRTTLWSQVANTGLEPIGNAIGHDKSFVSRFMSKDPKDNPPKLNVDEFMKFLEATGLVLVRVSELENSCVVPKEVYASILKESAWYREGLVQQLGR